MRVRFPRERRWHVAIAACAIIAVAIVAVWAYLASVDRERARAGDADRIVVETVPLSAPNAVGVTLWLSDEAPRDVEPFGGRVYAATAAGLAVYDERGRLVRRYTTLDGLPENPLVCLERFGDKLYIGTETAGLVEFDGERFTQHRFVRPEVGRISALRAVAGELLVGTFEAGLFEFDGATFTRRYQGALGDACRRVTALVDDGPRLYVGTFDAGVFEWREGRARSLDENRGLPSDRVTGLAVRGGAVLVSTDLGVAELSGDADARTVDRTPNAAGLAVRGVDTWVASLTRGVSRLESSPTTVPTRPIVDGPLTSAITTGLPPSASGVKIEDGVLWALTPLGLFASTAPDGPVRFERFDEADAKRPALAAGHVAALALDGRGHLWVGLFDGGVDVLDPTTGERLDHIDDPALHEINAIAADPSADRVWVASSRGLAVFDAGKRTKLVGEREGLAGENVAGIALGTETGGVALATNKGLSVYDGSVVRSISAFHGLPNNHAYTVAVTGGRTYVGTLGGLAEVDSLRVGRVFTTADSKLPHNWVNALAALDGRLYVGTYGGGVATLLPTGELVPAEETAGLEVNPGAMAALDRRLYVGTLKSGLYALDVDTGRWTSVKTVLSSTNVTAVAADAAYLYLGTEHGITRIARSALS